MVKLVCLLSSSIALLVLLSACATSTPSSTVPATSAGAAAAPVVSDEEAAAYQRAKPVFDAYCSKCHTSSGAKSDGKAMHHVDMTAYPFGGHHGGEAGSAVREALTGSEPSMPKDSPGSLKPEELALVLAWADAFDRAHPPASEGHDHDHDEGGAEHHHDGGADDHHDHDAGGDAHAPPH